MCGIAGFYSLQTNFSPNDLHSMVQSIVHRGPDNEGMYINGHVGLAHRRLSIIDLSENANQPMFSDCGHYVIVYNGEIYNFDDIRREFRWNLKTSSDTEVLLHALISFQERALEMLNGMFAFAMYDKHEDSLFIARDRAGKKPLYYYWDGNNFTFASELKSILAVDQISEKLKLNYVAINEFLHLGYIPEPHSIYENIYKLPAGSYLRLQKGVLHISKYWDVKDKFEKDLISDEYQAKEMLRDLVNASVRMRLKADVPYGTFLSGGIDSSLVTAFAQHNLNKKLNTFSIGFDHDKHDESKFARKVADYLGTDHHEFIVSANDASDLVPTLLNSFDEPYADSSAIPTMLVSKLARHHVTMVLTGDGGDELFHGYGAYNWANRLSSPLLQTFRMPVSIGLSLLNSRMKRIGEMMDYGKLVNIPGHIFSQEQCLFSRKQVKEIVNPEFFSEILLDEHPYISNRVLTPAENQSLFDFQYYLRDDLLPKVDRSTMKYSLEARVPLLDYNIIEFAVNLSPDLKIKDGEQKYLLKQLLYDYVPSHFFNRPKWGFSIPLKDWLKNDLRYLVEDYLSDELIKKYNIVDLKQTQKLKKAFFSGKNDYLYNRLWLLIVLHMFLERK